MTITVSREELLIILQSLSSFSQRLGRIEASVDELINKENKTMAVIDDLQAELANNTTVVGSVKQLVQNIKAALDSAGTNDAKLTEIKNALAANDQTLSDLVVANTPPPPPPTV